MIFRVSRAARQSGIQAVRQSGSQAVNRLNDLSNLISLN